ncbi:MAG: HAMP domain-containing histidine kinase [Candidatus Aegiribacteria sp.]|nr:HAMP domain-containing histidine kinase [Candidatus Aegiribacteria sp.]
MTEDKDKSPHSGIIQDSLPSSANRFVIVFILTVAFIAITAHFHLDRREGIGYTHYAYIPIIFAGFWWGRKAFFVALILGLNVFAFSIIADCGCPFWANTLRILSFLIVALVIGELSSELVKTHRALQERSERLRKTNSSLREFAKLRKAFLHIAIHDMKSPVSATTMLLHSLQTLFGDTLTEKQEHLVERMHARLDEAASFLRDFQLFAQLEDPSQIRKQAKEINLNELISDVVRANQDLAHHKKHKLTCDLEDNLSPIGGVERLIREVIANLVTNAIKYTPDNGSIVVRSRTRNRSVISLEVQDNGIGISEDNQRKLFREFVRIKDNDVAGQKVGGIGLGLSIAKRIIDMHGGRVYVISEPGKGSIFGFDIHTCPTDEGPLIRPTLRIPKDEVKVNGYVPD